jgi:hypothetical protein
MLVQGRWAVWASGFLAGVLAAALWPLASSWAQPQAGAPGKPPDAPRYAIASYAVGGAAGAAGVAGAYVLDVHTGDVFLVDSDKEPRALGKAGRR